MLLQGCRFCLISICATSIHPLSAKGSGIRRQDAIDRVRHCASSRYTINLVGIDTIVIRAAGRAVCSVAPRRRALGGARLVADFARLFVRIVFARMTSITRRAPSVCLAIIPANAFALHLRGRPIFARIVTNRNRNAGRGVCCTGNSTIRSL